MNFHSLRFRLVAWSAGLSFVVMLVFGASTYKRIQSYLVEVQEGMLQRRCQQIGELLQEPRSESDEYVATEVEARYAPATGDKFVRITRADGGVRYLSRRPNDQSFEPGAVLPLARPLQNPATRMNPLPRSGRLMISALPCPTAHGWMLVEVGATMTGIDRVLHALLLTLAVGLPGVVALGTAGGFVLVHRALSPVQALSDGAHEITFRHLDRRLPVPRSGDEIEGLAVVLNEMIERLDLSFQNTVRFTADASHELRTPLTIVRGELEALLSSEKFPVEAKDSLLSLHEEIEGLVRIVEGLFALARLDAGEAQAERVRIDLGQLVETTIEQMCLLAEVRHIAVTCTAERAEVLGDRTRLRQVVVNLLDNAVKYTPAGGKVELSVRPRGRLAVLEVADNGPGVPEAALPHLFKRFFRGDAAHTREIAGAGLGLSIVHAICVAHGGSVTVRNREQGGSSFTVLLPLSGLANGADAAADD